METVQDTVAGGGGVVRKWKEPALNAQATKLSAHRNPRSTVNPGTPLFLTSRDHPPRLMDVNLQKLVVEKETSNGGGLEIRSLIPGLT